MRPRRLIGRFSSLAKRYINIMERMSKWRAVALAAAPVVMRVVLIALLVVLTQLGLLPVEARDACLDGLLRLGPSGW